MAVKTGLKLDLRLIAEIPQGVVSLETYEKISSYFESFDLAQVPQDKIQNDDFFEDFLTVIKALARGEVFLAVMEEDSKDVSVLVSPRWLNEVETLKIIYKPGLGFDTLCCW